MNEVGFRGRDNSYNLVSGSRAELRRQHFPGRDHILGRVGGRSQGEDQWIRTGARLGRRLKRNDDGRRRGGRSSRRGRRKRNRRKIATDGEQKRKDE